MHVETINENEDHGLEREQEWDYGGIWMEGS